MKKHVRVAAGLIFEKGRIFATKRGESPYSYLAHKYEFPGGKLEPGESGPDTVKRELKEELSLDVKVGGLFAATTFEYPDFIVTLQTYLCRFLSDFQVLEHERADFLRGDELDENNWAPADAPIVRKLKPELADSKDMR